MTMLSKTRMILTATVFLLVILVMAIDIVAPGLALGQEIEEEERCYVKCRNRKGIVLGFNAGWGGTGLTYEEAGRSVSQDYRNGPIGGLRFGYAFSNSFILGLESYGVATYREAGEDIGVGAAFLTVTWFIDGGGIFLKAGGGAGGGEFMAPGEIEPTTFEDKPAGMLAVGYEWKLGRKFALGGSVTGIGFDLEGLTGNVEDSLGTGGFAIDFTWYL